MKEFNLLLEYAVKSFGFLAPNNKTIDSIEFMDLICKYYSLDNPKTRQIKLFLEANPEIRINKNNFVVSASFPSDELGIIPIIKN